MFRRALTLCVVLAFASVAQGAAVIELTALTPQNAVGGYLGGTTVEFQAAMSTDSATAIPIRLVAVAFHDTSSELTFAGDFAWDWSNNPTAESIYEQSPLFPMYTITYPLSNPMPAFMLAVPAAGGSLVLGTASVVLPAEGPNPITYYVDALNADSTDWGMNETSRFDFDFVNPTTWAANTDPGCNGDSSCGGEVRNPRAAMVFGDPLPLTVVPEPATLLLLGLGGVAVLRRRR